MSTCPGTCMRSGLMHILRWHQLKNVKINFTSWELNACAKIVSTKHWTDCTTIACRSTNDHWIDDGEQPSCCLIFSIKVQWSKVCGKGWHIQVALSLYGNYIHRTMWPIRGIDILHVLIPHMVYVTWCVLILHMAPLIHIVLSPPIDVTTNVCVSHTQSIYLVCVMAAHKPAQAQCVIHTCPHLQLLEPCRHQLHT